MPLKQKHFQRNLVGSLRSYTLGPEKFTKPATSFAIEERDSRQKLPPNVLHFASNEMCLIYSSSQLSSSPQKNIQGGTWTGNSMYYWVNIISLLHGQQIEPWDEGYHVSFIHKAICDPKNESKSHFLILNVDNINNYFVQLWC